MAIPISNVPRRVVYAASGTGPYAFTFEILAASDIAVYRDDTLLTLTTNYTVTINANGTGSVTLTAAPTGATQIAIVGNRTIQRSTDFTTGGDFFANTLNDELDQQTIFNQQNAEGLARALQAPQTDPTTINMTLPRASERANKYLAFDANGNPRPGETAVEVAAVYEIRDEIAAVSAIDNEVVTVAGNSANVTAVAGNAANINTVAGIAANVTTVAGISANVTSVAGNSSNINTVAGSNANVTTVATNIANVNTAATNIASINTAATNIVAIQNASSNASAAAASASAAAASESAAAASAAAAAASLDNFDDRYLGAKSSNPTVDNDGNPLVTGALYYRTTAPIGMKVYDGSQWLEASAAQQAALVTYEYVATAGQTTFSGADANALTLSYIAGGLIVSLNGVILRPGDDYTATNGTSVVLVSAAALNDEVCIYAFSSFQVANTYTQAQSDSRYAQLAAAQSFTAAQRGAISALTDGATITPNFALANNFSVTLGGNRTLANPTNLTAGQHGVIVITQDGTGSRTLAYGSNFKFPAGVAPTLTTTANAVDVLAYYVESASRITARLIGDVK
jgi:hypothetical protein